MSEMSEQDELIMLRRFQRCGYNSGYGDELEMLKKADMATGVSYSWETGYLTSKGHVRLLQLEAQEALVKITQ